MTRPHLYLLFVSAACLGAPLAASAAPITVPTGLNPGDQYRLVFVTSTTRNATSPDIADYNAFVTSAANSVPELLALGTTWKVIASTNAVDARDNTDTNNSLDPVGVPIYDLADTVIATTNTDLWDGSLQAALNHTESGTLATAGTFVWTGSDPPGWQGMFPALGQGGPPGIIYGAADESGVWWIAKNIGFIADQRALYAMSDVLTVVPEPSTIVLASLAVAALAVSSLRRRRHWKP